MKVIVKTKGNCRWRLIVKTPSFLILLSFPLTSYFFLRFLLFFFFFFITDFFVFVLFFFSLRLHLQFPLVFICFFSTFFPFWVLRCSRSCRVFCSVKNNCLLVFKYQDKYHISFSIYKLWRGFAECIWIIVFFFGGHSPIVIFCCQNMSLRFNPKKPNPLQKENNYLDIRTISCGLQGSVCVCFFSVLFF